MNFPRMTPLSRRLMTCKTRFLCDGTEGVRISRHFWQLSSPGHALFGALKPWRGETDHLFLPSLDPSRHNNYPPAITVQLLTKKRSIVLAFPNILSKNPLYRLIRREPYRHRLLEVLAAHVVCFSPDRLQRRFKSGILVPALHPRLLPPL